MGGRGAAETSEKYAKRKEFVGLRATQTHTHFCDARNKTVEK